MESLARIFSQSRYTLPIDGRVFRSKEPRILSGWMFCMYDFIVYSVYSVKVRLYTQCILDSCCMYTKLVLLVYVVWNKGYDAVLQVDEGNRTLPKANMNSGNKKWRIAFGRARVGAWQDVWYQ